MDKEQQHILAQSQAGMRLIAQVTFYNRQDEARARQFIATSYAPATLEEADAEARWQAWQAQYQTQGKQRIKQLLAVQKHMVVVVLEAEKGGYHYCELVCEDDYPHLITRYSQHPLELIDEGNA
jgi:hypothetical protein